jgi:mono/diheme cytochrome c family protein
MRRVKLRPWSIGAAMITVALMLALGTSLAGARSANPWRTRVDSRAVHALPVAAPQAQGQPGEALFNERCAVCHGPLASGRIGPELNKLPPEIANLPPDQIRQGLVQLVRGGIPGRMPMFTPDLLSDEQIGQIADYLVGLNGKVPGPSIYEAMAPITADAAKGQGRTFFPETNHSVGGEFLAYWRRNGGLRAFGYPLSEDYMGVSYDNGQVYKMQLFERVRMEFHPEAPAGQQIQLALLGAEELRLRMHFLAEHGM